jgi:hypothetical protein
MSDLKKSIIEKVIKPYNDNTFDTVIAEIVEYDNLKNKATIKFQDPKNSGIIRLDNVPVQLGSGGVHSAGPFVGDQVWVNFVNKSLLHPKIVALADERYNLKTRKRFQHTRKGSYLPEQMNCYAQYNPDVSFDDICPLCDDWFDLSNTNVGKYAAHTADPLDDLMKKMTNTSNYNTDEPGITHPQNSSTIKIRNNGAIDLFVATNQGVRIDPNTKTISIFGINENHNVTNFNAFIDEDFNVEAQEDISLKGKNVSITTGQAKITADTWSVESTGDVNVKSGKNIILDAGNKLILKGKQVVVTGNFITSRDDILEILNEEE